MEMRQYAQTHGFSVTPHGGLTRIVTPNDYLIMFNALADLLALYDHRGSWSVDEVKRLEEIRRISVTGVPFPLFGK